MDSLYTPSKWQQEFHSLTVNEALGAGAAGPGKSLCLLMDPIQQLQVDVARIERRPELAADADTELWDLIANNPLKPGGSVGWALHLRRTSPMLTQTLARADRIFKAIDPRVKFTHDTMIFQFSSGFRYQFGHCQHSNDWDRYMSSEYSHIGFDELVQFEAEQYQQIITRLRTPDPVLEHFLKARAMSNPVMRNEGGDTIVVKDPQWVRKRFVDPHPPGRKIFVRSETGPSGKVYKSSRIYLPAKLTDNPDPRYVEQYTRTLVHTLPHIRKALLDGDWYVAVGSYFADVWESSIHVRRKFAIPPDWPIFRSMDWGYKTKGVIGWFALDEDENLICIREYTFRMKRVPEVAKVIEQVEHDLGVWGREGSKIIGPADTQLWEERGESGVSKAEEFSELGIGWVQADKKSRQRNAERVAGRLSDHENGTAEPGLSFFSHCIGCITTIPVIPADQGNTEVPQKGGDDHHYDMVSYACAYASHGRSAIGAPKDDEDDGDNVDERPRGQYGYGGH